MHKLFAAVAVVLIGATSLAISTFDGAPTAPLAYTKGTFLDNWSVQIHDQSIARGDENSFPSINAEHGVDCSAPPATHVASTRESMVFQCANHVMTALNGDYGVIYLTPNRLMNLTTDRVVTWRMSTLDTTPRDWPDFMVSSYLDAQALPLRSDLSQGVDLHNPNKNSVVITTDNGEGSPRLNVIRNEVVTSYAPSVPLDFGIADTVNKAMVREPFKLTVGPTHVRFERLASDTGPAVVFFDETIAPLTFTEGVFSWGHHSYNPTKDCNGCGPATWHWDELDVEGTDFYINRASVGYINSPATITHAPAPANAYFKFSGVCKPIVNGVALSKMTDSGHPEHTASYMVAIPQDSTQTSISFMEDGWYNTGLGCHAKDFEVWAKGGTTPPPTPTPDPTPTPPSPCRVQVRNAANTGWTYNTSRGSYTGVLVEGKCQ